MFCTEIKLIATKNITTVVKMDAQEIKKRLSRFKSIALIKIIAKNLEKIIPMTIPTIKEKTFNTTPSIRN